MKKQLLIILLFLAALPVWAQDLHVQQEDELVGKAAADSLFPGGTDSLLRYVALHTQYPEYMLENGIEGSLRVNFVLTEKGKVDPNSLEIIRPACYQYNNKGEKVYLQDCKLFEEEAKRVVRTLPPFKPSIRNGKAVKIKYQLPFRFQLGN